MVLFFAVAFYKAPAPSTAATREACVLVAVTVLKLRRLGSKYSWTWSAMCLGTVLPFAVAFCKGQGCA